jgi:MinD superfamily P-loop ATPase
MAINSHAQVVEARAEVGAYSPVSLIKNAIKKVESANISILDSPPGISCPFIATVEKADFVVLVTEPTPFGLNDLKLSVETLQELNRPFGVIINRAGMGDNGVYDYLKQSSIPLLMEIPFDKEIAHTYSEGRLLVNKNPLFERLFIELLKDIENLLP